MTTLHREYMHHQVSRRNRTCTVLGIAGLIILVAMLITLFVFFL